jgi:hypothetical protein
MLVPMIFPFSPFSPGRNLEPGDVTIKMDLLPTWIQQGDTARRFHGRFI